MTECPSRLVLARFHAAELDASQNDRISAHIDSCTACSEAMQVLKHNIRQYEKNFNQRANTLRNALEAAQNQPENVIPIHRRKKIVTLAVSFAAAAMLVIGLMSFWPEHRMETSDISYKGSFAFSAVVKRNHNQFKLQSGSTLQKNDALRFVVQTGGVGYVYIFDLDANGNITSLYPFGDTESNLPAIAIASAGQHTLDDSIVLDDSTGVEHLVAVFSQTPFNTGLINAQMAKMMVQGNKEHGDSLKMPDIGLPQQLKNASVGVITILKR